MLTKGDLDNALQYYPHIARQIQEVANNRATLVKKRSQIARRAAAEGIAKLQYQYSLFVT